MQYYLGCITDYERSARAGADRFEDYDELLEGLSLEIRRRSSGPCARGTSTCERRRRCRRTPRIGIAPPVSARPRTTSRGATPQFDTVFDAMAWAAAHPFPEQEALAAAEPLEMPPIADVEPARMKPKHRPAGTRKLAVTEQERAGMPQR